MLAPSSPNFRVLFSSGSNADLRDTRVADIGSNEHYRCRTHANHNGAAIASIVAAYYTPLRTKKIPPVRESHGMTQSARTRPAWSM